ncbi:MAG: outer membrane beta-barrel protein, partial [Prevotellaceae bacterium]|nr:outer membrane beta-barrel protein [Prevotellaceae bacterium]
MNRKIIINLALLMAMALPSWAISIPDSLNYTFRIGYNIGGTAPIGMPVTIRSLNSYDFQPNITLGLDVQKDIWGPWGLLAGVHIENKGMKIDATVKNYHMEMVQGGEHLEGMYTGNLVTECNRW